MKGTEEVSSTTKAAPAASTGTIVIEPLSLETVAVAIVGKTPLIMHRMSEKAKQELLMPKGRKTAADKATTLKHDPIGEFRAAAYVMHDEMRPTYFGLPSALLKRSMMDAALRIPGAKKTEIAQLVHVEHTMTDVYGLPEVFCAVTRSSDMNRTPDVRTRPIFPEWAAFVEITYAVPFLTQRSILNLLTAAGQICGLGDWRLQKGGPYGAFLVTDPEQDERFQRIVETQGKAAQIAALEKALPYDSETQELLDWYEGELVARGRKAA